MARRRGSLLENTIEKILTSVGLEVEKNVRIKGYEIDVYIKYKGFSIAIECKERSRGSLVVRNLIHEWSGKNKILKI